MVLVDIFLFSCGEYYRKVVSINIQHEKQPPRKPSGYWENKENINNFFQSLKQKLNLNNPEDWNSITYSHIKSNGGGTLLKKYSIYELKCMACPEGKSLFNSGNWENKENILQFLTKIKEKYNLNTPDDWNSITYNHVKSNGGSALLAKYSMFELKCLACPEGKLIFNNAKQIAGYWENKENILRFLEEIKEKYNLKTPEDWNSITTSHIQSMGGRTLITKYSMFELKCMACPEGKSVFNNPKQPPGYWENQENILQFLSEIQKKYNLNSPEDWNSVTRKLIKSNGGRTLLSKYSMFELKCLACPEGKSIFNNPPHPAGYWENQENILQFLSEIKEKYNLNTPEDWNSITTNHIQSNGGRSLLLKNSMFDLKCMACPEGKSIFNTQNQSPGYWENQKNILQFLSELQQKYNLKTPEDWNSITTSQIQSMGGRTLLSKYSMYKLKCMACPEGELIFKNPPQPPGYWENKENIQKFLSEIQEKYNLNTIEDWNSITYNHIKSNGGSALLSKCSIYELKCMACPEGKSIFAYPKQSSRYWENKENILQLLSEIQKQI